MLRVFLEHLLVGPSGMTTVGQPVMISGEPRLLFARVTNLLSDGDGHRIAWDWKGAASLKPCFKHYNVFKLGSGLAARREGYVEGDCVDAAQFRSWPADKFYSVADTVVAAEARVISGDMAKSMRHELEQSVGINNNRSGLLMSSSLRFWATKRFGATTLSSAGASVLLCTATSSLAAP